MNPNSIHYFNEFDRAYETLRNSTKDDLTTSYKMISFIENHLHDIHRWLRLYIFDTVEEEIYFFKELKPLMVSKLLYYKALLKLEAGFPQTKIEQRKFYETLLVEIHLYNQKHRELYEYYRSRSSHRDQELFVRCDQKNLIQYDCSQINYDSKISTYHDYKIASFISNDMQAQYIQKKLDALDGSFVSKIDPIAPPFYWTAGKVAMTEMVYAFQATGSINHGHFDLIELAQYLGSMFHTDIESNLYGNYSDIKNRKGVRTRYLNSMSEKVNEKMDREDAKRR